MYGYDIFGIMESDLSYMGFSTMEFSAEEFTQSEVEEAERKLIEKGYGVHLNFVGDGYILKAWSKDEYWH